MPTIEADRDFTLWIESLTSLTAGQDLYAGSVQAWDNVAGGIPRNAVFVTASGGIVSRPIKGGPDERRPSLTIQVRNTDFVTGQTIAREIFDAVDQNPPVMPTSLVDYCDARCLNSQPVYIGRGDDGPHEWSIIVNAVVDYTP